MYGTVQSTPLELVVRGLTTFGKIKTMQCLLPAEVEVSLLLRRF